MSENNPSKTERTCQQCGKIFVAWRFAVARGAAKFCSKECHSNFKKKPVERTCQECGRVFIIQPSVLKKPGSGRFCSRECLVAKSKPVERTCETCSKAFLAYPRELAKGFGKFCSVQCKRIGGTISTRLKKRIVEHPSGCHLWTGAKRHYGHGTIKIKGVCTLVRRLVWELANGPSLALPKLL